MLNENIKQIGANPESVIQQLRISLTEIIAKAHRLKSDEEMKKTIEEMKELLYKLNYSMLTFDKTILSITGLQGVGKTKIIRDLYCLDDELLPSDGGRGEALPVLFTETANLNNVSYFVRRAYRNLDNVYELRDDEINMKELNAIARNPDTDDLWLEVRLPQTYFNSEISLALLPGFEKDPRERSQRFLDTLLKLSTSVLLVFNHKKIAVRDQQLLIEKMAFDYKENRPVFALSFAEELNRQERESLVNDLTTKFNIPVSEQDRIVFTGIGEEFKGYPMQLLKAISMYSLTNASGYRKQLNMLYSLSEDIISLTGKLEKQIDIQKNNDLIKNYSIQKNGYQTELYEIQGAFRHYKRKVSDEVRQVINQNFLTRISNCASQVNVDIANEKSGIFTKVKLAFNKDISFKEKQEFHQQIKELWQGPNGIESEKRLIRSLETYISDGIKAIQPIKSTQVIKNYAEHELANPLLFSVINTEEVQNNDRNEVVKTAMENINKYIENDNDLSITLTKNDLKVLPIVAVGVAQELIAASLILEQDNFNKLDQSVKDEIIDKSNFLVSQFRDLTLSTSTVIKGAAVFFGIDVLDGTIDTFGALTGILTTVGMPASAITPIGMLIIGTIGAGLTINRGIQRIEKYKFERSRMAEEMFKYIANSQEESIIATINNILNKMEDKLIDAYHRRHGTDTNFGLFDELDNRINRLQQQCGKLQEMAFRNESYIN